MKDNTNSDTTLSDSKENLLEFIQKESLLITPQSNKIILETYACALWKGFFDMKHKLQKLKELDSLKAIDMGLLLIDNVFWIIYNYSANIQLTLFLTERGRLLYTEFLYMSRTHQLMKELNAYPTIHDGFQFAIKKSIGALTCKEQAENTIFQKISCYRSVYRNVFHVLNTKYLCSTNDEQWTDDEINITLNVLNHKMSEAVHGDYGMFEYCINTLKTEIFTITSYLLMIQLLCDITIMNSAKHATAISSIHYESIIEHIYQFIDDNSEIVDSSLDCLHENSLMQHKWKICKTTIMHQIAQLF